MLKGDCTKLLTEKKLGGRPNLVIADPPYNIGARYKDYKDRLPVSQYMDWTATWVDEVLDAMDPEGSLWVFINDMFVSEVDVLIKSSGMRKRSHVVWYYTFGQNQTDNFTPSHTHLLYYVFQDSKDFTFNQDDEKLRHPSARQVKYKDKRANPKGRLPDNTWAIFPELLPEGFDPAGDTWLASRVCGTFEERENHSPNQIPVPMMERIIRATSNPGDLVLDPFCGSGSSGVAAKILGRYFVGIDISPTCVEESRRRIKSVKWKQGA